jgi:hypothetical protein
VTSPTIPGAAEGYNGKMSAAGYGSRLVVVLGISHGPRVAAEEAEAANYRVLYTINQQGSSFSIRLSFRDWQQREDFSAWMREYMRRVATNQRVSGYMLTQVPARRFSRLAVPMGPLPYGDEVGAITYPLEMQFKGASDPTSAVGSSAPAGSRFVAPAKDASAAAYYPAGVQRAGAESLEGTFFDTTPERAAGTGEVIPYADITAPVPGRPGRA